MEANEVKHYPCSSCGADLLFEPGVGSLKCPYCGLTEAIAPSTGEVEKRSFERWLKISPEQMGTLATNALEVRCQGCGAKTIFTPPEVAGKCDFCGVQIVAQAQSADPIVAPSGLLPFHVTQGQASSQLGEWLSSRWFAPSGLKQFAERDKIHGVYIPYWTYDANTITDYTGQRGEYYYETETYYERDSQGNQEAKTRQVRHTRWYSVSGRVTAWFFDVLIAGTNSLPPDRLAQLEPWDLEKLRSYDPAFLAGFRAQRYQVGLAEGFELAKETMAPTIERDVRNDIGGDEQRIDGLSTEYEEITFRHLLLPVYAGAYRYNGKLFQILVNGRTGEVQGERPYSIVKIGLLVIAILLIVLVLILVLQN